ncbi:hypothetical protein IDSA_08915 [Pseudidiomarina salinarum]|uniref:Uncharacterized protein n=1 Tax=Pseudidiomarina salinarum TaxID=435908 RepID=A0A094L793_9GAMM|nr:hypothetical protein [Pseudidiomarina salinarum]KFZ30643.1 hypothetical protein IDSA_08915 [Pseudidiomarina salinarum]RUO69154.1 hypothetical protein CWI79_09605 [Pseudidiomarina salinarum]
MGRLKAAPTLIVAFLFFVWGLIPTAFASTTKPEVVWAGVGFSGNWGERASLYPFTSSFFCNSQTATCDPEESIETWARQRLLGDQQRDYPFSVKLGQLDTERLEQIGLVITIANESISSEKMIVGDASKTTFLTSYSIIGSALFFDVQSKKMIFSVPLVTRYTTAYEQLPGADHHRQVFRNLLQDETRDLNFFSEMAQRLRRSKLDFSPSAYVRITQSTFGDAVKKRFSSAGYVNTSEKFLATFFENVFVKETGYALIPNAVGHAVGNKIATRIPSGDLTIELPEPGYEMTLHVAKLMFSRKPGRRSDSLCWGGKIEWRMNELLFGSERVGHADIKNVNCAVVGKQTQLSHDVEFMKLLLGTAETFAKQFSKPDRGWLKKHTDDEKVARQGIEKIHSIFATDL